MELGAPEVPGRGRRAAFAAGRHRGAGYPPARSAERDWAEVRGRKHFPRRAVRRADRRRCRSWRVYEAAGGRRRADARSGDGVRHGPARKPTPHVASRRSNGAVTAGLRARNWTLGCRLPGILGMFAAAKARRARGGSGRGHRCELACAGTEEKRRGERRRRRRAGGGGQAWARPWGRLTCPQAGRFDVGPWQTIIRAGNHRNMRAELVAALAALRAARRRRA